MNRDHPWKLRASTPVVLVVVLALSLGTVAARHIDITDPRTDGTGPAVETISGDSDLTVTYSTRTGELEEFVVQNANSRLASVDSDWAYIPREELPAALERVAGDPAAGVVTVGPWALVGDLDETTVDIDGTTVSVVATAGADLDTERKAAILDRFLSPYSLQSSPTDEVRLVYGPSGLLPSGRTYGTTAYVAQQAFWDGRAGSVWIHEYVHTQRQMALAEDIRWFSEASATYFSYRVMEEQYDRVSEDDVRHRIGSGDDYPTIALSDPDQWNDSLANYKRGSRLLYVVDDEIRESTDGESTLFDVYRELNTQDGHVTVDDFVDSVEHRTGEPEPWLRSAIEDGVDLDPHLDRINGTSNG